MDHTSLNLGRLIQSRVYRAGVFGRRPAVPVEPAELEAAAGRVLGAEAWAYINGSAGQQRTDRANLAAFERYPILPRVLVDVSERDQSTTLFGRTLRSPMLFAPIGVLEMAHKGADLELARGAREVGLPMVISTQASVPMEEIAAELGDSPRWYQLYWPRDEDLARSLVARAEAVGAEAIEVTLDTHLLGWRVRDLDRAFLPFVLGKGIAQYTSDPVFRELVATRAEQPDHEPQPRPTPTAVANLVRMTRSYPGRFRDNLRSPLPRLAGQVFTDVFSSPALTWDDLARLRSWTDLPILLKGVQDQRDAKLALDHGVDGLVVSNHGGRQVDGAIASLDALVGVAEVVGDRVPIIFDSGVRSGADVFKALALGASAVQVGRPWVYGLALAGARGVVEVMESMMAELDITMGLAGVTRVDEVERGCLA